MSKATQHLPSRSSLHKPGLVPTVAAYQVIMLVVLTTIGIVMANAMKRISDLATNTRDEVLPAVVERQRTAVNLERLGRFAETVYSSKNPRLRRQYKLAAHILSQDSVFEDDHNINRQVVDAFHDIEKIAQLRSKQDRDQTVADNILLSFAPGSDNAKGLLALKQGQRIGQMLTQADKTLSRSDLSDINSEFEKLVNGHSGASEQAVASIAKTRSFLAHRKAILETNSQCETLWNRVNISLEQMADNLSINAAAKADTRFTQIANEARHAIMTGLAAACALLLALAILLYFAHRDIVVPIIRCVQGLDKVARGDKELDLPKARLRELEDIGNAVTRSAVLMTQLADRTQEMQKANATLEAEIEVREMTQRELARSKEQAEAADRAKSDFLAGMSHEIRTPMNTILGMADLMLATELTPDQRQYIEVFQSSGEMLLGIINDVLDLSKIEAGEIGLETTVIDMEKFISRTHEIVAGRARQKGLEFIVDTDRNIPSHIMGDPVRLRQVLVNLIDNAVKFTEEGHVCLAIRRCKTQEGGCLTFTVMDTGIGIPAEAQKQIFQRFTQADTSTTRKYGGTGLGLAISRRLVELMGGSIHLESSPRQGSTFYFSINFAVAKAPQLQPQTPLKSLEELSNVLSKTSASVLIAEDSESNQALIELYFKNTACRLDFATDGLEAMEKFMAGDYDLVLMDIQMPVMDGYEATRKIREYENRQGGSSPTPIVAVTANAFKEDQERCLAAGCTDYLAKPVSKIKLLQCVARHVLPQTEGA